MSRWAPYGWSIDPTNDSRLIPIQHEQFALNVMKELRNEGYSLNHIARRLMELGIKPRGKKWYVSTISGIVKNIDADDINSEQVDQL